MFRNNFLKMNEVDPNGGGGGGGGGAPFTWPENWKEHLPDDLKSESSLGVIKDIPSLAKSYVHAQKHIGSGKVIKPTEHSTDADWKKFFNEIGVPEKMDDYLSDMQDEKHKTDFFKAFKEMAHGAGLLPQQSKKLLAWYDELVKKDMDDLTSKYTAKMEEARNMLKKDWGHAYEENLKKSDAVVKELNEKIGNDEFVKMLEETGLGNDPRFAKAMIAISGMIGEDTIQGTGSAGALTPAQAQEKILAYQGDLNGPYYNSQHPNHKHVVAEVQKLYQFMNPKT